MVQLGCYSNLMRPSPLESRLPLLQRKIRRDLCETDELADHLHYLTRKIMNHRSHLGAVNSIKNNIVKLLNKSKGEVCVDEDFHQRC